MIVRINVMFIIWIDGLEHEQIHKIHSMCFIVASLLIQTAHMGYATHRHLISQKVFSLYFIFEHNVLYTLHTEIVGLWENACVGMLYFCSDVSSSTYNVFVRETGDKKHKSSF